MGSGNSSESNHDEVNHKTENNGCNCYDDQPASKAPEQPESTHQETSHNQPASKAPEQPESTHQETSHNANIQDHLNHSNRIPVLEHLRNQVEQELQKHIMSCSSSPQDYGPNPVHSSLAFPAAGMSSSSATRLVLPAGETVPEAEASVLHSRNANPAIPILQRQIHLYDELINLSRQLESSRAGDVAILAETTTESSLPVAHQVDTGGNNLAFLHPIGESNHSSLEHISNIVDTSAPYVVNNAFSSGTNAKAIMVENLDGIHPASNLAIFPDAREAAYQSQIVEVDSNALARLLKKHFNNFVLECEFNATGNDQAYQIIRARRCDHLRVDETYSAGHNLTIPKTKDVADLFLKYCMSVIDAQCWGGELRYAITKPKNGSQIGSLLVRGVVNYLTADRLIKMDGPYQVEVDFILVEDA